MSAPLPHPYGRWPNPVSAAALTEGAVAFDELHTDGDQVYWVESRADEDGRSVLVAGEGRRDLTTAPMSVSSRVHEYGGSAALVAEGTAWFVNAQDQRVYRCERDGGASALTPADDRRYGDLALDRAHGRLLAVCEDHRGHTRLPINTIVAVPLTGGEPQVLVGGNDFYLAPRVSPDGTRLAWLAWDFPRMPWDGTELRVAEFDAAGWPVRPSVVAGGAEESVCHPQWSPDGVLHYVSDRTGWWNLYAADGECTARPIIRLAADIGQATAMGRSPYDVGVDVVVAAAQMPGGGLLVADRNGGPLRELVTGLTEISQPRLVGDEAVVLGGSATAPIAVLRLGLDGSGRRPVRATGAGRPDPQFLAEPQRLAVPAEDGGHIRAYYYPPRSPHAVGPDDRPPPLVVAVHGGPVARTTPALAFGKAALTAPVYWTSRGYAVLDMDYRGSIGYGRDYRQALYRRWGELDVSDCVQAARFLIRAGRADADRVVIRGGSAGGFTTLCALATTDFFAGGTALFPVADLESFQLTTHKYEARYADQLIGEWPKERHRYVERSPVHNAAALKAPVLLLHGTADRVCPLDQAQSMADQLRELDRDVELVVFDGEGHGFGRAETIDTALRAEAAFYTRIFGWPND